MMKKITLLLLSALICGLSFGQFNNTKVAKTAKIKPNTSSNETKSGWVGLDGMSMYPLDQGQSYYVVGTNLAQVGNTIERIKVKVWAGTIQFQGGTTETFSCTNYTISIYENPTLNDLGGAYDLNIGTPIYTQSFTTSISNNVDFEEITLNTPYVINNNTFWIAVTANNGNAAIPLNSTANAAYANNFYMDYYDTQSSSYYIFDTEFSNGFLGIAMQLYVNDGTVYQPETDLELLFVNVVPNPSQIVTTQTLASLTDPLYVYNILQSNGPDAATGIANYEVFINGSSIGTNAIDFSQFTGGNLPTGYYTQLYCDTISAAVLDQQNLYGTFTIEVRINSYTGTETEINAANNSAILTVTRPTIAACNLSNAAITNTNNNLSATVEGAQGNLSYAWSTGETTATITATQTATYSVTITDNITAGCTATASLAVTVTTPTCNLSNAAITNTDHNLSATVEGAQGNLSYAWSTGETTATITVTENATYSVTITDNITAGCTATASILVDDLSSINGNEMSSFNVYPNPSNGLVNIISNETGDIIIQDIAGKLVNTIKANSGETISFELSAGMYIIRQNSNVSKIIVE